MRRWLRQGAHRRRRLRSRRRQLSPALAKPLGLSIPVQPVKGYSATFAIDGWNEAPLMPLVDYSRKMAVTRLGDRIRLAGTVEFTGLRPAAESGPERHADGGIPRSVPAP